mgnify:CR=1 FL=1
MTAIDTTPFIVSPGTRPHLEKRDPAESSAYDGDKKDGKELHLTMNARLEELQELLYAEGKQKLLIVLQAMDTGGKDSTIRHVFDGVNPQGVKVASFKKPTETELAHDYLWRAHRHTPARGEISIFNRSHYEDVLVVRVENLVPEEKWRRRYAQIRDFERMLAEEGVTIRKFFLHISKAEQRERMQSRLDEPHKRWKFSAGDLEVRKKWDAYQEAFEEMIAETSTEPAPWIVVPADRKWQRNLIVSQVLIETLEGLDMQYPDPEPGWESITIE